LGLPGRIFAQLESGIASSVDDLEPLDDLDDPVDKHEYFNLIASYFPVEAGSDASRIVGSPEEGRNHEFTTKLTRSISGISR
jgi:hypothetical protein